MRIVLTLIMCGLATQAGVFGQNRGPYEKARNDLVDREIIPSGIRDSRVLQALRETPRHEFVPRHLRKHAYFDMSLPIGDKQTISSPFIVAFMTECLEPDPQDKVLEIGTGSGFQAAVLSPLVKEVYTIEIVESLGRKAARTLKQLGYENVSVRIGDGFKGWPEKAPFDKIIVTCSPEKVPAPLINQLREGGRMVIPVGQRYQQTMYLFTKVDGTLKSEALRPTLFVPMTGDAQQQREVLPDPANPQLVNGSFEKKSGESEFIPGWYYQRQARQIESTDAPHGDHYVEFKNQIEGRASRILQGFSVDGRRVDEIQISGWVRVQDVDFNIGSHPGPRIVVTFYGPNRGELGQNWLGPWRETTPWKHEKLTIRVPKRAREAIIRVGLFGATGSACFDAISVKRAN